MEQGYAVETGRVSRSTATSTNRTPRGAVVGAQNASRSAANRAVRSRVSVNDNLDIVDLGIGQHRQLSDRVPDNAKAVKRVLPFKTVVGIDGTKLVLSC